jgi:hypothetical protein
VICNAAIDLAAAAERQFRAIKLSYKIVAKDRRRELKEHAWDRLRTVDSHQLFLVQILDGPILIDFELIYHHHRIRRQMYFDGAIVILFRDGMSEDGSTAEDAESGEKK